MTYCTADRLVEAELGADMGDQLVSVARSPAIIRAGSPGIMCEMTKVTTETPKTTKTRRISRRRIVLAKDMLGRS